MCRDVDFRLTSRPERSPGGPLRAALFLKGSRMLHKFLAASAAWLLLANGCLFNVGCFIPISAERMAGYYAPSAKASKSAWGASIELGTSFTGKATYNADTGTYEVVVDSKPEPVLQAQAERAAALENLRQIEATANVEIAKAWSQAMTQSIGALSTVLQGVVTAPRPQSGGGIEFDQAVRDLLTPENVRAILGLLRGDVPAPPPTE